MPREIFIDGKGIGEGHPTFFIAELGINHQGDIAIAKQLIHAAREAGADAVKFQKRSLTRILVKEGLLRPYTGPNSFGKTYGEHKKALELDWKAYSELKAYAEEQGLVFMASGWDEDSVDFLEKLGISSYKVASADLTNHPLLEHTAKKGKPVLLSTGMASMDEVREAVALVRKFNDQLVLFQCTSTYPSSFEEINLRVIQVYQEEFDAIIAYSGHELGIAISEAAVVLGARVVERHLTLNRTMKGTDHAASLEPGGFGKMVRDVRALEKAMGDGKKRMYESEVPIRKKLAKSVVSKLDIPAHTTITREMLTTKGPGSGIPPAKLGTVLGRQAKKAIPADSVIMEEDLE